MRQPFSNTTKPFKQNKIANGSVINAVDYDLGTNGYAYFDNDTANQGSPDKQRNVGNRGHVYRNDGVDIRKDSALYESYYVTDIENGEWLQFTFDNVQNGKYTIELTIASDNDSGMVTLGNTSNRRLLENITVPNSGGLKIWKPFTAGNIIVSGKQVLRLYFVKGGFNLKSIRFVKNS